MESKLCVIFYLVMLIYNLRGDDDLSDFDFSSEFDENQRKEIMIAQESRQHHTIVKPPISIIKRKGITNSHRPQYNIDSLEADVFDKHKYSNKLDDLFDDNAKKIQTRYRSRQNMIRDAVLRALERKDNVGKFAQILPIVRAMTGSQRVALASLVASQVTTPPGRLPLNLSQVRSMFGNDANTTSDLMLPILFDMANLIRRSARPGKEPREVKVPQDLAPPEQMLRRSDYSDDILEEVDNDYENRETTSSTTTTNQNMKRYQRTRNMNRLRSTLKQDTENQFNNITENLSKISNNDTVTSQSHANDDFQANFTSTNKPTTLPATEIKSRSLNISRAPEKNSDTLDLSADATNHSLTQDLPVAEKLRALTRFVDRKGNIIRRGQWSPNKSSIAVTRRTTADPSLGPSRKRIVPSRKLPVDTKCELFTNSLCLHVDDYPIEAILLSIRRNKAATSALLADYRDPNEGAIDGVTSAQEAKYNENHYLVSNRRGDMANRDFAGAGEAGFMCPSTVKYARPQRARATSGQWKYIVNTGEHTQTLRLEKCLKPKESCTYLTDNFKSKCVQVYNYHRLLTWDQQNGLHMDIFKVPTCCSCHIEGYNVAFPPLGHRVQETPIEQFPGEDLSSEHGNGAFESIQPTAPRPTVTKTSHFGLSKPIESFPNFGDNQNFISGAGFQSTKLSENDEFNNGNAPPTGPVDSYGNDYFPDSFNQASSIKNIKRPPSARNPVRHNSFDNSVTLPSYLEPPTPSDDSSFALIKESQVKYKPSGNHKRSPGRHNRRPIRKNTSGGPEDLLSSGTSAVESQTSPNIESLEDFNDDRDEYDIQPEQFTRATIVPKLKVATSTPSPKSTSRPLLPTPVQNKPILRDSSHAKRVNYNYHPIIDFFEGNEKIGDKSSINRGDVDSTLIPIPESEWKPINRPTSVNTQTPKVLTRRRYK